MLRHVVGIVSGGASGLGAATVAQIVKNGGRALAVDLSHQRDSYLKLASSVTDAGAQGDRPAIAFAEADVTDEAQIGAALDLAEETFGEPVNVAVSCAGSAFAKRTLSIKQGEGEEVISRVHPLEDYLRTMQVNAVGTFNLARLSSERMSRRDPDEDGQRGCIVNTASIAAYDGQTGQVAYSASKGAIVGMTLPLARDLAPFGIRVVTVAPGLFKTPLLAGLPNAVQNELGSMAPCPSRLGDPEEFGHLVGTILTNHMLNGETIRLDGALRMPP